MDKELKRYFEIVRKMRGGLEAPSDEDYEFFIGYSPKIDKAKVDAAIKAGEFKTPKEAADTLIAVGQMAQSSPEYKDQALRIAQNAEKGRLTEDFVKGANLLLAGTDIGASIQQIQQSNRELKRSRKPVKPVVPQRDQYLQQALRQSQVGTQDAGRALAPAQAQIQDQYQNDIANAKIASTGQAGAFGAYGQLAANRRNRAAGELAPMADEIRRGQQARQDDLIGARMNETQNMFDNNARFYNTDMDQYQQEQAAAASLGSQGRENLRNSMYNFAGQAGAAGADYLTDRKYRNLRNRAAAAYGPEIGDIMTNAERKVDDQWRIEDPQMGSQMGDSPNQGGYLPRVRAQYGQPWNA